MSRTARIVLAGLLTAGALVVGGVALAANPAPSAPSNTVTVEEGGLRPAQDVQDPDCPRGATGGAVNAAIRL